MPLLRHDLTRAARRGRLPWVRTLYALALLAAVYAAYVPYLSADTLAPRDLAAFANRFATTFAFVQLAAVAILAPAYGGGVFAEERQRGTLDLLLTTQLRPREIVRAKLLSRVLQIVGVLLIGVPFGALLLLLGGLDVQLLVGSFLLSVGLAASLSALGLAYSARAKSVASAVTMSYVMGGTLLGIASVFPPLWLINPFAVLFLRAAGPFTLAPFTDLWLLATAVCALLHGAMAILFVYIATRLLTPGSDAREHAVAEAIRMARRGARAPQSDVALLATTAFELLRRPAPTAMPDAATFRAFPVPPPDRRPLVWKELYFGGHPAVGEMVRSIGCLAIIFELLIFVSLTALLAVKDFHTPKSMDSDLAAMARGLATLGLGATVLVIAAFAAGSVAREREQRTLDALLTLPYGRGPVLRAKWLGSVLRGRWPAAVAAIAIAFGTMTESISPGGALFVVLSAAAYAAFCASLGVWMSVASVGSGRAVFATAGVLLATAIVPVAFVDYGDYPGLWPSAREMLRSGSFCPPLAWMQLAYTSRSVPSPDRLAGLLLAAAVYAALAVAVYGLARWRFAREAEAWNGSRS